MCPNYSLVASLYLSIHIDKVMYLSYYILMCVKRHNIRCSRSVKPTSMGYIVFKVKLIS